MNNKGLFAESMEWFKHPLYSDGTTLQYVAALVLLFIVAFLWSTVVKQID